MALTTTFEYDRYGRQTKTILADHGNYAGGNASQVVYDTVGNVVQVIDGKGTHRHFRYDALNRLTHTSTPQPVGVALSAGWWGNAALVAESRTLGRWGELRGTSNLQGAVTSAVYDIFGRQTSVTDATGQVITYGYNSMDQVVTTTYSSMIVGGQATTETTTYHPHAFSVVSSVTNRNGHTASSTYDKRGLRLTETSSLGALTTYTYDVFGRTTSVTNHLGERTSFGYDRFDRLISTTLPDHVAGTNERIQTRTYDDFYRVLTESGAGAYSLAYTYDAAGNVLTITDAKTTTGGGPGPGTTTWEYDSRNRVTKKIYADGQSETFTYDAVGNTASRTDAKGVTTTYGYTALHQLALIDYPSDTDVTFTYDSAGRKTQMVDGSGTSNWTYDAFDRATSYTHSRTGQTVSYTYNVENGRETMDVRPTGAPTGWTTSYGYDNSGRLATITDPQLSSTPFTYGWRPNANLVASIAYPNGPRSTKSYDLLGRLTSLQNVDGAPTPVPIEGWTFAFNKVGHKKEEVRTTDSAKTLFTYDPQYQLTSANRQNAASQPDSSYQFGFSYDEIGNRKAANAPPAAGGSRSFVTNKVNQYTNITDVLTYDNNGNLTYSAGRVYAYSEENRLKRASPGGTSLAATDYVHDGLGRVIERRVTNASGSVTVTRYVLDGGLPVMELDGSNAVVRSMTRGLDLSQTIQGAGGIGGMLGLRQNGASYFYFSNTGGHVVDILATDSSRVAHYEYGPYGDRLIATGLLADQPYQYSSKAFDEQSELVDFGQRFYSPRLGRWINRDPIGEAGGVNLYAAFANDPANNTDAWGHSTRAQRLNLYHWERREQLVWRTAYLPIRVPTLERDGKTVSVGYADMILPIQVATVISWMEQVMNYGGSDLSSTTDLSTTTLEDLSSKMGIDTGLAWGFPALPTGPQFPMPSVLGTGGTQTRSDVGSVILGVGQVLSVFGEKFEYRGNGGIDNPNPFASFGMFLPWTRLSTAAKAGTLTAVERAEFQAIADKHGTIIDVVGGRAAGKGRNIHQPEFPVGKGPGTRSDIDTRIDTSHLQAADIINDVNGVSGGAGNASMKHSTATRPTFPPFIRIEPKKN